MTAPLIRQVLRQFREVEAEEQRDADQVLTKPKFGTPCNGCGYCCQQEACRLSVKYLHSSVAPCIALEYEDGRFWCGLARDPAKYLDIPKGIAVAITSCQVAYAIGIDAGCDSDDPSPDFHDDKLAATRAAAIAAGLTLAQEYADKWAGLRADAIRTQGDTK